MNWPYFRSLLASKRVVVIDRISSPEMPPAILDSCFAVGVSLLVRLAIGLGSYSGASTPPMYGDYEAQRHWMEIAIHLPVTEWYRNSSNNDLNYWGLDYPPLSGYQSLVHGKIVQLFEAEAVELQASQGYETHTSKLLMRWSVVFSDLLFFMPAVLWACRLVSEDCLWVLLLQPSLLLIDHGHFQYNCISLGLVLLSVTCILTHRHLLGSVLFVCAFNHKHMSLYYALAFFAHLFGHCLHQRGLLRQVAKLGALGATVIGVMALLWLPYLHSLQSTLEVVQRLVPISRGLYEDYVSNFCGVTLVASIPSGLHQVLRPSQNGFLYGLVNTSLAFYLFSYQVHEKSILMPALVISLLMEHEAWLVPCFHLMAAFSLFPLLYKDGLSLQYIATLLLFLSVPLTSKKECSGWKQGICGFLLSCCFLLHVLRLLVVPPESYPFLHDFLLSTFCFTFFLSCLIYLNVRQWNLK